MPHPSPLRTPLAKRRRRTVRIGSLGALALVAVAGTACSGSPATQGNPAGEVGPAASAGETRYATGGTLTVAQAQDPGALDPQLTALNAARTIVRYAYDTLLHTDETGKLVPGLADRWEASSPTRVTYHLRDGVTCSDGTPLQATDVAANFAFVGDPENASPLIGIGAPAGVRAVGDNAARTITLTTAEPTPFFLESTGTGLFIICGKGTADRKSLAAATNGTGPYVLTESVPNDHYTFTRRPDYAWGPNGADTKAPGTPERIVVRIVADPATAMNLLLAKQINLAPGTGAEAQRARQANLTGRGQPVAAGELWFNQAAGRPGADDAVRRALVGALDARQVGSVLTGGQGVPSKGMVTLEPRVCSGDTVSGALPTVSTEEAERLLDSAGWARGPDGVRVKAGKPLAFKFVVPSSLGPNGAPGSELLAARWKELGATVTLSSPADTALQATLFSTGDWDAGFVPLNVQLPTQYAGFVSGPTPPKGTNFAHIQNPAYQRAVTEAASLLGAEACAKYEEGERALISDVDVAPLVNREDLVFANGAEFRLDSDGVVPHSLRLLA